MPTVADLGRAKKAQRPGVYDDIDDAQLGLAIQAKHPGAYGDFSPAPATSAPVPAGLQPSPPPGFLSNLAHSALNYTSMGPTSGPDLQAEMAAHPGENPLAPWPAFRNTISGVANTFMHPSESFYQDPIATANTFGSPVQMLTRPSSIAAIKAGGGDIAAGVGKTAAGAGLAMGAHELGWGPLGEYLGAKDLVPAGVKQVGEGLRSGWNAFRGKSLEPSVAGSPSPPAPAGRIPTKGRYTPPPSGMRPPVPETPPAAPTASGGGLPSPADVDAFLARTKGVKLTPEALKEMKQESGSLPAPKPIHQAGNALDTYYSEHKAANIARHLQDIGKTPEDVEAMHAAAKASGNWGAIGQIEKDAWKTGQGKYEGFIPKQPYRLQSGDRYAAAPGNEATESTWDRVVRNMRNPGGITPPQKAPE